MKALLRGDGLARPGGPGPNEHIETTDVGKIAKDFFDEDSADQTRGAGDQHHLISKVFLDAQRFSFTMDRASPILTESNQLLQRMLAAGDIPPHKKLLASKSVKA